MKKLEKLNNIDVGLLMSAGCSAAQVIKTEATQLLLW